MADKSSATPLSADSIQSLFRQLSTAEVANGLLNLELAAHEFVVDASSAILQSPIMRFPPIAAPVFWAVRRTAHAHFCAGESLEDACESLRRYHKLGLRGILDYGVEDALDDAACDRNLEGFLRTVAVSEQMSQDYVSFACVKLSAICPLPILTRASSLLRYHHDHPSYPLPWLLPSLPVLTPDSPRYLTPSSPPPPLLPSEEASLSLSYRRLQRIAQACSAASLPLLVDAEYLEIEPAIDHLAYAAAVEFNGGREMPLVYSTVQCYLKDAHARLATSLAAARDREVGGGMPRGLPFGVKLVRGAYLVRESATAKQAGGEVPIHNTIEQTHACYDRCGSMMIDAAAEAERGVAGSNSAAVMLATHNYASGRSAILQSSSVGLPRTSPRLFFAQLKGMADGLSLGLAAAGFNACKYLPFGRVDDVMPYLLRRAQENRGMLSGSLQDRRWLRSEFVRRILRR